MLYLRINLPTRVTRGSAFILNMTPLPSLRRCRSCRRASASTIIERNFNIRNGTPAAPTRFCLNKTGPGLSKRISKAVNISIGEDSPISVIAPARSKTRFVNRFQPARFGVETCMSGKPASGCVWMRGPAISVRAGAIIMRMFRSASAQPNSRIVRGGRGTPDEKATASGASDRIISVNSTTDVPYPRFGRPNLSSMVVPGAA